MVFKGETQTSQSRVFMDQEKVVATMPLKINDLPVELVGEILRKLTVLKDIRRAYVVCRLWKSLVEALIGVPIRIGSTWTPWDVRNNLEGWQPISIISRCGISECLISSTTVDIVPGDREERFVRPTLLKKITLRGDVDFDFFNNLLPPLSQLTVLSIDLVTICHWPYIFDPTHIMELQLKELRLTCGGFRDDYSYEIMEMTMKTLSSILRMTLKNLTTFVWSLPLFLDFEYILTICLAHFVIQHSETLKYMQIHHPYSTYVSYIAERENMNVDQSINLVKDLLDIPNNVGKLYQLIQKFQFEYVDIPYSIFPTASNSFWTECFLVLKGYKLFIEMAVSDGHVQALNQQLTHNAIFINIYLDPILNLGIFRKCDSLTALRIASSHPMEWPRLVVMNSVHLVSTLGCLEMFNTAIMSEDLDHLITTMKNLKILKLCNLEQCPGFGLTFQSIPNLWVRNCHFNQPLSELFLQYCINLQDLKCNFEDFYRNNSGGPTKNNNAHFVERFNAFAEKTEMKPHQQNRRSGFDIVIHYLHKDVEYLSRLLEVFLNNYFHVC